MGRSTGSGPAKDQSRTCRRRGAENGAMMCWKSPCGLASDSIVPPRRRRDPGDVALLRLRTVGSDDVRVNPTPGESILYALIASESLAFTGGRRCASAGRELVVSPSAEMRRLPASRTIVAPSGPLTCCAERVRCVPSPPALGRVRRPGRGSRGPCRRRSEVGNFFCPDFLR